MPEVQTTFGAVSFQLFEKAKYGHPFHDMPYLFLAEGDPTDIQNCAKTCFESKFCAKFLFLESGVDVTTQCYHYDFVPNVKRHYSENEKKEIAEFSAVGTAGIKILKFVCHFIIYTLYCSSVTLF